MLTGRAGGSRRSYPRKSRGKAHGRADLSRLGRASRGVRPSSGLPAAFLAQAGRRDMPRGFPEQGRRESPARSPTVSPCFISPCRIGVLLREFPRPDVKCGAERGHGRCIDGADAGRQQQGRRLHIDRPQCAATETVPPATAQAAPVARAGRSNSGKAAEPFVHGGGRKGIVGAHGVSPAAVSTRRAPPVAFLSSVMPGPAGFGRGAGAASSENV